MANTALETRYRRYIDCLNERRLDEAGSFYADRLLYNGKVVSRDEWRRTAIEDSFDAMPDLQWHVEHLVIDGRHISARLRDTGTLRKAWQGLEPSGVPASFGEHVFYRFDDGGQIDEAWSIFDVLALGFGRSDARG